MADFTVYPDIDTFLQSADNAAARGLLGITPTSVVDNAAKLALTGILTGQQVIITGEANRIEQFQGGDITLDANWGLIGANTIELVVRDKYDYMGELYVNGVQITPYNTPINVGWLRCDEPIPIDMLYGPNGAEFDLEKINGAELSLDAREAILSATLKTNGAFIVSVFPPRAIVQIYTYT